MARVAIWQVLKDAVEAAGVDCQAYPSGVTVEIGDYTDYEPDALVNAGPPPAPHDFAAPNPVVIVEVLANDARTAGASRRIPAYFSVPSVQHFLWVHAERPEVVRHGSASRSVFPIRCYREWRRGARPHLSRRESRLGWTRFIEP